MLKLAPSLLAADFTKLGEEIKTIEKSGISYLHLDVMDGHFVPNLSFGVPVIKSIRKATNMIFDVHLMIEKPENYIDAFAEAGADIINFHIEACKEPEKAIKHIRDLNKKPAITVKPKTNIEDIYKYLEFVDMVLIMSVEPGFGGQSFINDSLKKARDLSEYISKKNLKVDIEMDGGIYLSNVKTVLESGVNIVVAGSAVFGAKDISEAVKDFHEIFEEFSNK